MNKRCCFIILILTCEICEGQNLVPNPSFEDTFYCPFFTGVIAPIKNWWATSGNSVDCYHSCASFMNVPNSPFGYQYARTGEAMIGIVTYVWQFAPDWPNYREYAGAKLLDTLQVGQKYYLSFYMNCAGYLPGWQIIAANKMGMRFSTVSYDSLPQPLPDNFAHLYTDSILMDTVQWMRVSGSFVADSAYTYVILGNFFDYLNTDTIIFGGAPFGGSYAYYYIDDVCVSTDSLACAETQPCSSLTLTFTTAVAKPPLSNGAMRVSVVGGDPPYLYSLDSLSFQTSNTFTSLALGNYQVYVTDSNGCTGQETFTIDETNCNCNH